ncbi:hypothetical protein MCOR19_004926 [Pyricularia oryzae]|nr:hypothetical protein MCOR19_004926 [Pyricularia oryzae]KAI6468241.1 hypothetical protein MCOR15_002227 [Pyricularia oryzae]KAI6569841.1 hypothetical protein MCOR04_008237 [Pyricularia oryzae]
MHVILTGATGFVGSIALDVMLNDDAVTKVTIISRKEVKQAEGQAKVNVILQDDLSKYDDATLAKLKGASGCVWALGPPYMSVSKEEYEYAHIELPAIAAKIFSTLRDRFNFVYVSHDKCDEHKNLYAYGIKDRAEEGLLEVAKTTPSLKVYAVRPALIDSSSHEGATRWRTAPLTMTKRLTEWVLIPLFRVLGSELLGTSQDLGIVMVDLAIGDGADLTVKGVARGGRCVGVAGMAELANAKRAEE